MTVFYPEFITNRRKLILCMLDW